MNAPAPPLAEIGEALQRQLSALERAPSAELAAQIASNLDGCRQAVLRVREALMAGVRDASTG